MSDEQMSDERMSDERMSEFPALQPIVNGFQINFIHTDRMNAVQTE